MNEFFTWQVLVTYVGASAATAIITQFLKNIFAKIPTQIVSYFVSLIILVGATAITSGGTAPIGDYLILIINAVLVSLSANGVYSAVVRITDESVKK